jgi:methyl coenzyme M reductase alpha subunit
MTSQAVWCTYHIRTRTDVCIHCHIGSDRTCDTKVADLDGIVVCQEQVVEFDVAMRKVVLVNVRNGRAQLNEPLDHPLIIATSKHAPGQYQQLRARRLGTYTFAWMKLLGSKVFDEIFQATTRAVVHHQVQLL